MIPTGEVTISINEKEIKNYIEEKLSDQVNQQLLLADINKLSEITCMSVRYLEEEILHDPRVKLYERKKSRKRWWLFEPTREAIRDVVNDW